MLPVFLALLLIVFAVDLLWQRRQRRRSAFEKAVQALRAEQAAFWRARLELERAPPGTESIAAHRTACERSLRRVRSRHRSLTTTFAAECQGSELLDEIGEPELTAMALSMDARVLSDEARLRARRHAQTTFAAERQVSPQTTDWLQILIHATLGAVLGAVLGFGAFMIVNLGRTGDPAQVFLWMLGGGVVGGVFVGASGESLEMAIQRLRRLA